MLALAVLIASIAGARSFDWEPLEDGRLALHDRLPHSITGEVRASRG
jgi:hypothetical protein